MRVLVTRPQADAERTARELAARGHEPVLAPILKIAPTNEPPPSGAFDAVVLTSANAAPRVAALEAMVGTVPLFAVGARTAFAARRTGWRDVRTAEGDATSLAHLITGMASPGQKLLLVAGRDRKAEPEAALAAAGFVMVTWTAYEAVAADRFPEAGLRALRDGGLDAALHYSRRSADIALDLVARDGLTSRFCVLAHVCLSDDVASPLHTSGAETVIVPSRPDEASLLAALDRDAVKLIGAGSPMP